MRSKFLVNVKPARGVAPISTAPNEQPGKLVLDNGSCSCYVPGRPSYAVREAAGLVGVGKTTLFDAIGRGEVPCIRIGKRVTIPGWWVDARLSPPQVLAAA